MAKDIFGLSDMFGDGLRGGFFNDDLAADLAWLNVVAASVSLSYLYKGSRAWSAVYRGTRSDAALYLGTDLLHS